jgi:hypothetical protein
VLTRGLCVVFPAIANKGAVTRGDLCDQVIDLGIHAALLASESDKHQGQLHYKQGKATAQGACRGKAGHVQVNTASIREITRRKAHGITSTA